MRVESLVFVSFITNASVIRQRLMKEMLFENTFSGWRHCLTLFDTISILGLSRVFSDQSRPLIPDWFGESILAVNHRCVMQHFLMAEKRSDDGDMYCIVSKSCSVPILSAPSLFTTLTSYLQTLSFVNVSTRCHYGSITCNKESTIFSVWVYLSHPSKTF